VIIDRTHKPWAAASGAILFVALLAYVPYARGPVRPSGGSWPGLVYGIAGFGLMVFVTLLSLRKKFPIWRIGRTQTWMRGHLWLGGLSFPLILLHAAFGFGHGLAAWMMWLFLVVVASGILGAWLQHTMPRRMLRDVPMETIFEQIAQVRGQLVDEADGVVADASGRLEVAAVAAPVSSGANALASVMRLGADDSAPLREFYVQEMRPFLGKPSPRHPLADQSGATTRFTALRALVPPEIHPAVADLESICEEERQLMRQETMHRLLHGWLLVHVPLSFVLMALAVVHIVVALRY
jgi:hypothetical protein